jgi:lipopolysaccharide exporter
LPMYFLANSVGKVAFPAFSQMSADVPRLRGVYLRSSTLVVTLVLPLCAGVAVAAPQMVAVLLGPQWAASAPVLRVLCLAIPLSLSTMFAGIVADARANLHRKVVLNLEFMCMLVALFWLLRGYGIMGVAAAIGIGEIVRTFLYMRITHHDLGVSYAALLAIYGPGLRNALGVSAGIALASAGLFKLQLPVLLIFIIQILAGAVVLAALLLRWPPPELRALLRPPLLRLAAPPLCPAWGRAQLHAYAAWLHLPPAAPASSFAAPPTVAEPALL